MCIPIGMISDGGLDVHGIDMSAVGAVFKNN
jgi:hypothetical protein